eukprot:COSAG02_NODE_199_length_29529_cov_32.558289_23_plen_227_part_00
MAPSRDGFRFLSLVRPFMSVLPEVVQPDRRIPFRYVKKIDSLRCAALWLWLWLSVASAMRCAARCGLAAPRGCYLLLPFPSLPDCPARLPCAVALSISSRCTLLWWQCRAEAKESTSQLDGSRARLLPIVCAGVSPKRKEVQRSADSVSDWAACPTRCAVCPARFLSFRSGLLASTCHNLPSTVGQKWLRGRGAATLSFLSLSLYARAVSFLLPFSLWLCACLFSA